MIDLFNHPRSKVFALVAAVVLIVSVFSCTQPAPTPTPTTAPKAAPTKAAETAATPKPAATAAKTESKEAKPAATAVKSEAKPSKEATKGDLFKLTIPYSAVSGMFAPLWVTKDAGLFEKYGLDVTVDYIASSTTMTAAMLSGEVKVGNIGSNAVIQANLAGGDVVLVAGTSNMLVFSLYGRPDIKRVEDLKGKAVGVSRFGASTDFGARQTIKKFGLEPEKDVAIIQTGGSPETLAALVSGGIQGAVFGAPSTLLAKKAGMHEIVAMADLGIPYSAAAIGVRRDFLKQNPEVVRNMLKAVSEGIARGKQDKEFAMKVIGKYVKSDDKDVQAETYDNYFTKALAEAPYVSVEAVQTVLDAVAEENPKAKDLKPDSFIDNSLVKELDDSGFVKKLYGR